MGNEEQSQFQRGRRRQDWLVLLVPESPNFSGDQYVLKKKVFFNTSSSLCLRAKSCPT